LKYFIYALICM